MLQEKSFLAGSAATEECAIVGATRKSLISNYACASSRILLQDVILKSEKRVELKI